MRKIASLFVFLLAAGLSGEASAQTLGDLITNTYLNTNKFALLASFFAYCTGCLFCVIAIFKLKDHVDNPQQTPLSAGLKRFFAGGMFLSLPFMANVAQKTVFGGAVGSNTASGSGTLGAPVADPSSLDEMVVSLMADVAVPFEMLLSAFTYCMAIGLLLVAINRLTKRMDEGPRGPAGMGTIMTFIVSGVLFAFGDSMGALSETLFGKVVANTVVDVDPDDDLGLAAADAAKINQVIHGVMLFITLVGMIAFIRGWLVLRAYADGQQGATMAQGLTFLFGGALAINLGDFVNALQNSLGISGITFNP